MTNANRPRPRLSSALTRTGDDDGFTIEAIARELGVSRETVRRRARQLGLGRRTRGTDTCFTAAESDQLRRAIPGKPGRPRGQ